jgi:trehalose synthase
MSDLGLDAEWQVVRGTGEFARVNKMIGNALGGLKTQSVRAMLDVWLRHNAMNAGLFDAEYDFVVVHDPQPAGIPFAMKERWGGRPPGKWLWHCHLDLTLAQQEVWDRLRSYLDCCYDAAIFGATEYVRSDLDVPLVALIPPAIDPLNTKSLDLDAATRRHLAERYGIDPNRPVLCQVARFVKWSDPMGVIDAYRLAKQREPDLQLVLVWAMPGANAESWRHFQRVAAHVGHEQGIHLLSNLNEVGNLEQSVFLSMARVVVHRSLRKGFAAPAAEASWKARPVVVDRVGVMPQQVIDGHTGYVVDSVGQMADRVVSLLHDGPLAERMGSAGREHVRERFLITRSLREYLNVFRAVQGGRPASWGARLPSA